MSPILHEALLLFAHLICIITLAALLAGELILFRKSLPADLLSRLQLIDRWYGIFAALVILTGFSLGSVILNDAEYRRIRTFLVAQLCLFIFIPLCATLMAAGI